MPPKRAYISILVMESVMPKSVKIEFIVLKSKGSMNKIFWARLKSGAFCSTNIRFIIPTLDPLKTKNTRDPALFVSQYFCNWLMKEGFNCKNRWNSSMQIITSRSLPISKMSFSSVSQSPILTYSPRSKDSVNCAENSAISIFSDFSLSTKK